jgi:hypothetical protein
MGDAAAGGPFGRRWTTLRGAGAARERVQGKRLGQLCHQLVLDPLHASSRRRLEVVVPVQVQKPVNHITHKLRRPRSLERARLCHSIVETKVELAMQRALLRRLCICQAWLCGGMVEGDDIRGAFVLKEGLVYTRHFFGADQMQAKLEGSLWKMNMEEMPGDAPEQGKIDAAHALPVSNRQMAAHGGVPR